MADGEPLRPTPEERERWIPRVLRDDPRHPSSSDAAALVWDGMVWGRLGRADRAWVCWSAVGDPSLVAWVAAERGRVLREFGLHESAKALEEDGLGAARDVTDIVMLRISLAADALGTGDPDPVQRTASARRQLDAATSMLRELPPGPRTSRQRLRARWVAAEVAMASGARADVAGLPWRGDGGPAFPIEHEDGTDFHRAKGLLFAGVVRKERSLLQHAAELAPPALLWAVELARLEAGEQPGTRRAAAAWDRIVPPEQFRAAVEATPTAQRLRALV